MGCSPTRLHLPLLRCLLLVSLAVGPLVAGSEARGAAPPPAPRFFPLECRLGQGPWQSCRMEVVAIGSQWSLLVGSERWDFRHDGRGSVTMQHGEESWRPVSSRWVERDSLCWDGICARGAIPLD